MDRKQHVMIMGGTRGLGASLAEVALERGLAPIVLARSCTHSKLNPEGRTTVKWDVTNGVTWRRAIKYAAAARPAYLVWNVGIFVGWHPFRVHPTLGSFRRHLDPMINVHLRGAMKFLHGFHAAMISVGAPYHLITIASRSASEIRDNETIYCALEAGKAHGTRNFAGELVRDLPGSKTTLVHPGGMQSGFLADHGQDVSNMMPTRAVAEIIWGEALALDGPYDEYTVRNDNGTPHFIRGVPTPKAPFPLPSR